MCAVVRAFDDGIEAEPLGATDELQVILEKLTHVLASRMLSPNDQAELHPPSPISGARDIVFRPPRMQARSASGMIRSRGNTSSSPPRKRGSRTAARRLPWVPA